MLSSALHITQSNDPIPDSAQSTFIIGALDRTSPIVPIPTINHQRAPGWSKDKFQETSPISASTPQLHHKSAPGELTDSIEHSSLPIPSSHHLKPHFLPLQSSFSPLASRASTVRRTIDPEASTAEVVDLRLQPSTSVHERRNSNSLAVAQPNALTKTTLNEPADSDSIRASHVPSIDGSSALPPIPSPVNAKTPSPKKTSRTTIKLVVPRRSRVTESELPPPSDKDPAARTGKRVRKQSSIGQQSAKSMDAFMSLAPPEVTLEAIGAGLDLQKNLVSEKQPTRANKAPVITIPEIPASRTRSTRASPSKPPTVEDPGPIRSTIQRKNKSRTVEDSDDSDVVIAINRSTKEAGLLPYPSKLIEPTDPTSLGESEQPTIRPISISSPLTSPVDESSDPLLFVGSSSKRQPAKDATVAMKVARGSKGKKPSRSKASDSPATADHVNTPTSHQESQKTDQAIAPPKSKRTRKSKLAAHIPEAAPSNANACRVSLPCAIPPKSGVTLENTPSPRVVESQAISNQCPSAEMHKSSHVRLNSDNETTKVNLITLSTSSSYRIKGLTSSALVSSTVQPDNHVPSKLSNRNSIASSSKLPDAKPSLAQIIASSRATKPVARRIGLSREDRYRLHMHINPNPRVQKQVKIKRKKRRGEYDSGEESSAKEGREEDSEGESNPKESQHQQKKKKSLKVDKDEAAEDVEEEIMAEEEMY